MDPHEILLRQKINSSRLVIFDFDGTLVNLEELNFKAFQTVVFDHIGEKLTKKLYAEHIAGTRSKRGLMKIFKYFEEEVYDFNLLVTEFRDIKEEYIDEDIQKYTTPIGNMAIFLWKLRRLNKTLALGTASSQRFARRILEFYEVFDLFDHTVFAEDVVHGKPNPEVFDKLIQESGQIPRDTIIFEDSLNGLKAAKLSGGYVIGIHNSGWNDDYVFENADTVIEDYREPIRAL